MKTKLIGRKRKWLSLIIALLATSRGWKLFANPQGMTVVSGSGSSQANGSQLNITVGQNTFSIVQRFVDDIVTLPDKDIFDAMIWIMSHCKLVVEGAAAAPVAALLHGLIKAPTGSKVVAVLSGGNVNLDQLKGLKWN